MRPASRTAPSPPFPVSTSTDSPEGAAKSTAFPPSTSITKMFNVFAVRLCATATDGGKTIASRNKIVARIRVLFFHRYNTFRQPARQLGGLGGLGGLASTNRDWNANFVDIFFDFEQRLE